MSSTSIVPQTDENKELHRGRPDGNDSGDTTADISAPCHSAPHKAGVVIRASVEHIGVAGETELTVNVKWPASAFCVPACSKPAKTSDAAGDARNLPANAPPAKIRTVTGTQ
jgi:hypothetical protein